MYYIWRQDAFDLFVCRPIGIDILAFSWLSDKDLSRHLPEPIRFVAENDDPIGDFTIGTGGAVVISEKIAAVLKRMKVPGVDFYRSEIVLRNGSIISGYYSISLRHRVDCLDEKSSICMVTQNEVVTLYLFRKLCLNFECIPEGVTLFRLFQSPSKIIIHHSVKEAISELCPLGIDFFPVGKEISNGFL